MTRSQKQKAYRKAAKRIANGWNHYCCTALACLDKSEILISEFTDYFQPEESSLHEPWFPEPASLLEGINHDAQSQRMLALYFMSHAV